MAGGLPNCLLLECLGKLKKFKWFGVVVLKTSCNRFDSL
ncbi:hypothetical protein LEP1GSC193_2184 [Leptospira alstonii serovar Pingchang str. 80-412]|uniref:Uncharacterized protein n=2 Tax=Leptospira alstonii TaxID=28452 RepID=M6DBU1_9LEPT|nr:hypothetical protein LEP1GSC194_0413 [Leptospira alstonii serovar Sichuan str. 79601]EQA79967.1 hypothetical protein LEP1GSC193_2184 [Leptospira alstonii serovar Pingchang str. 80-412]